MNLAAPPAAVGPGTASRWRRARWRGGPPLIFVVPAATSAAGTLLVPSYLLLRVWNAGPELWNLIWRGRTLQLLLQTVGLTLAVTATALALAVPLAWLTGRTDLPGRRLWALLTPLPLVIPTYVGGFAFAAALGPRGLLQHWLAPLGVQRLPDIYGFPGAWLALSLFTYPYALLSLRAALRNLDPSLEEASRVLGRGPWTTFWRVTLPQLRPALAAGGLLVALYTLSDFGAVSLLRFDAFTRAIYVQYQGSFDRVLAAGLALILVALTLVVVLAESHTHGRARYHRSAGGVARPPARRRLGVWRGPALAFCASVVLLALGVPLLVLIVWLVRGFGQAEALNRALGLAWNSLSASGLAALVTLLLALPVAVLAVRCPGRLSGWLERLTYLGFALPGIVVALALVFFGANYAPALYQTLPLLILAYAIRFLPQAVGAAGTSLRQVNPHCEEAARSLGRGPLAVLGSVTVPLIRSGLLAGALLVFLTAFKELPATLLLSPTGFRTLATEIWTTTASGAYAEAAVASLVLMLVAALPTAWLAFRERDERHA